ncbi:MAG: lysine--tRNA ligase [Myxococcales bacterium FL481]|nr:MAG: lysine--tRNA ligase [Myxococcales bacterium FL481]
MAKSWPFVEARKLAARMRDRGPGTPALLETGYGPSGLPHMGTFGEVARTTMVRRAYELLTGQPTRLITFSDDMDGLRKIPDNVPNADKLAPYLQKPLTQVPDPFGRYESFAHHNNAKLRQFLDDFGFEYEFMSSTECYRSGAFDGLLLRMLECYDDVLDVILPTLGEDRRASYSPFLPISPSTGRVLYVPVLERNVEAGTIVFEDEDGKKVETPVTGGAVKLQWKADWAGRWYALGVDYEMAGEDLTESVRLSSRITSALGGTPPVGFNYQLFLDHEGKKISKSKGNGLSLEEWLRYASPESLALFMFIAPKKAKRLHFDVIPKTFEDYHTHVARFSEQEGAAALDNPAWHVHQGEPPAKGPAVGFSLLLNLVGAADASDKARLWAFLKRYEPSLRPESEPELDRMVGYAINYYTDFVRPTKSYRAPTPMERAAMEDLVQRLSAVDPNEHDAKTLQDLVFAAGKSQPFEKLRDWFQALYQVLLGQAQGPRFGSFVAVFGVGETIALIKRALAQDSLAPGE